ncbi:MAG: preprotein translocase subunit YajC [Erythrobacter sp.]|nr:preprotein translocase subunit YajC [Erythrobacter sp.]
MCLTLFLPRAALWAGLAAAAAAAAAPALAQRAGAQPAIEDPGATTFVQPYIEVSQVLTAELTPGDDVLTFTQIAAGVDTNIQGRNSGLSVSLRYERNIGYGDQVDSDAISGIARGSLAIVPQALTFEAGALASRARIDNGGGVTSNPLVAEDLTSQIYSIYAGPSLATRAGDVDLTANAQIGYNRLETGNAFVNAEGNAVDAFDESVIYAGQVRAATRAGDPLPVGIGVGAGAFQEDVSNLDQRVRDLFFRADVTVPLSDSLAVIGGIGYEDVEVSSRDALRDADGVPIVGENGRFITDESEPRRLAFDVDGLIWDVGVQWRPSSRTSLTATVGKRYDSTTYYGNFTYAPDRRSALSVNVYDGITSFGGALNNSLAGISSDFTAARNPLTGDFTGLITGTDGALGLGLLGSIRSTAFRGRGGQIAYQREIGRMTAAIAAGYDRREFIGAEGTVFEEIDGIADESYYITGSVNSPIGQSGTFGANAYVNWFESGADNGDLTGYGASAAYSRLLTSKLSARAALSLDYFDSEFTDVDFAAASALVGLRYDF